MQAAYVLHAAGMALQDIYSFFIVPSGRLDEAIVMAIEPLPRVRSMAGHHPHRSRCLSGRACLRQEYGRNPILSRMPKPICRGPPVLHIRSGGQFSTQSRSMVPSWALWKYWLATSQPFTGRNGGMQVSSIRGTVVRKCTHQAGS